MNFPNTIPCSQILLNFLVPLSGMKLLWCITNMIISSFQNAEFHTPHVYILQTWRYFQAHLLLVYIIHWYLKTVFFTHHINTWIGPPDFHTPLIWGCTHRALTALTCERPISTSAAVAATSSSKTSRWDPENTPEKSWATMEGQIPISLRCGKLGWHIYIYMYYIIICMCIYIYTNKYIYK